MGANPGVAQVAAVSQASSALWKWSVRDGGSATVVIICGHSSIVGHEFKRGMVDRETLDDDSLKHVEVVEYGPGRRLPPYACFLSSPLVRKIASLSAGGTVLTIGEVSEELCRMLDASVPGSRNLKDWLCTLDFLCATPSPEELSLACHAGLMRDLRQAMGCLPSTSNLWCRVDDALARDILDRAAQMLTNVSASERSDVEAADYPAIVAVTFRAEHRCAPAAPCWATPVMVVETLNALASFVDNRQHGEMELHSVGHEMQARALLLLSRSPQGALAVLRDWLPSALAGYTLPCQLLRAVIRSALRTLYALECQVGSATSAALVNIEVLTHLHEAAIRAGRNHNTSLLPLKCREASAMVLANAPSRTPWPRPLASTEELRAELLARVPWLEAVEGDFCVTGSLLTESIVHHGDHRLEGMVADVDLFCSSETELPALAASVEKALGLGASSQRASSRRWLVTSLCKTKSVDVYANSLASVCGYHLPLVRCCFSWQRRELYLFPSCAIALAWGINIDMQGFVGSSQKNPFEVLDRKMQAGFTFVLTPKEYYQLQTFTEIKREVRISRVSLSRLT